MILIETANNPMTIKVGQEIYYKAKVHGSVGIQPNVTSDDENVLKLTNTHLAYKNPKHSKMAGGDSAIKTYIFEAVNVGNSTITIQRIFRGKLENEFKIEVEVEK